MVVGYGYGLAGLWEEKRGAVPAEPEGEGDVREWEVKKPNWALISQFCDSVRCGKGLRSRIRVFIESNLDDQ